MKMNKYKKEYEIIRLLGRKLIHFSKNNRSLRRYHRSIISRGGHTYCAGLQKLRHTKANVNVLFVLGGPGCGKGTHCKALESEFEVKHVSAGELLRMEQEKNTEMGRMISQSISNGEIVPATVTVKLLLCAMLRSHFNLFLIDGFPRNQENLEKWQGITDDAVNVLGVLHMKCPETVLCKRLLSRGLEHGRDDDNLDSIKKRIETYKRETLPVISLFEKKHRAWHIDSDRPYELVREEVKSVFEKCILGQKATCHTH